MYNSRQHSSLLLQATTTNACEAWHSKLKYGAGLSKGQVAKHGLFEAATNIVQAGRDVDNCASTAASHYRHRALTVCTKQYPDISGFPQTVQKLLAIELSIVLDRIAADKQLPSYDNNNRGVLRQRDVLKVCCIHCNGV